MKYIKLTTWTVGFFLLIISVVLAEEIKKDPIARVLDKQIYYSDIAQEGRHPEQYLAKMSKEERSNWIKTHELKTLESLIYSELQNEFLTRTRMEPTHKEIQLFVDFSIKNDESRLEELELQRKELLVQIRSSDLAGAQRGSLNEHLGIIDQFIKTQKQREDEKNTIPNYDEIYKESRRNVASSMVKSWKFNKALYDVYGGRVIFQQFGLEPIDAYKAFLDEHTQAKSFEVFDAKYHEIFKDLYAYFEMKHSYMNKEEVDKYFSEPWWDPAFEQNNN